ncbi:hypothetical protein BDZ97DRAFT_1839267 [Flammula alnicola]|nr:hypothetical protein BDZ97DRAFT_1839267 [Flammula alnicola]
MDLRPNEAMGEPGFEDVVSDSVHHPLQRAGGASTNGKDPPNETDTSLDPINEKSSEQNTHSDQNGDLQEPEKRHKHHSQRKPRHHYDEVDEEESSIYQPTLWWFTSTAFPLFAGTFGPIASLFSVCGLVETWRIGRDDGRRIRDPTWTIGLNASSLFLAFFANIILLFNFARRIRYAIAQPLSISLWYMSAIFLIVPIGFTHGSDLISNSGSAIIFSQSYYYAFISSILYFSISSLLLMSSLGSIVFHAYPPSFSTLTRPQRTLMLQTLSFSLYLALGAGVFSSIENWGFADGLYWADYTVLTIGLGTDFPLTKTLARMLLIPYAAFGITLVGLVVASVRGLVLERARAKVVRRHLGKQREKWKKNIKERHQLAIVHEMSAQTQDPNTPQSPSSLSWREKWKEQRLTRLPRRLVKHASTPLKHEDQRGAWHRPEFELMRFLERNAEQTERYASLGVSFLVMLIVWGAGSLIFWYTERKTQGWTYPESFYFTYTTLLTIGYGDFFPTSPSGKPFFVVWSLISVPAMTVLISNMGDTVVKCVKDMTVWVSKWTILPERDLDKVGLGKEDGPKKKGRTAREGNRSARSTNANAPHSRPQLHAQRSTSLSGHASSSKTKPATLERDVELMGKKVEGFEHSEGRPSSLAARLAREISKLAKDLRKEPPKKYTWDEWTKWLDMLGERDQDENAPEAAGDHVKSRKEPCGPPVPILLAPHGGVVLQHTLSAPPIVGDDHLLRSETVTPTEDEQPSELSQTEPPQGPHAGTTVANFLNLRTWRHPWIHYQKRPTETECDSGATEKDVDWRWTWLGDQGPLFSRLTETEWIMEKLCFRLEEVLEEEIREAHASAAANKR